MADSAPADRAVVDQLDEVWRRVAAFGAELTEDEWRRPTEVPGWSVQDNLAHLTDVEAMLSGRPRPEHDVPSGLAHVRNDMGERNEVFVDARRSWKGVDVLAEFVGVTTDRVAQLRASTEADFDAPSWTPLGPGTVRDLLPFRSFDSWVHEQDMRRAVDRPGGLAGPAAEASMDLIVATAGFVVGKKVAPPDGTTVVVECTAPLARTFAVAMRGARATTTTEIPDRPTVRITVPGDTYARLACGRVEPDAALAAGAVRLAGDVELGRRVVKALNFLF